MLRSGEVIKVIIPSLKNIFEEYKDRGINSIYLWGSVTTEDFDPESSDIDSVAIVDDKFDIVLEDKIRKKLQAQHPDAHRFGFRALYEGELRSGDHIRSPLSSFIPPRLLLLDLPDWLYVDGKIYSQGDLSDDLVAYDEAVRLRLQQIRDKNWDDASNVKNNEEHYYLKKLWRIVHLLQLIRGCQNKFSYSSVVSNAKGVDGEREITKILEDVRQARYDRNIFLKYVPEFNSFLVEIKNSYLTHSTAKLGNSVECFNAR